MKPVKKETKMANFCRYCGSPVSPGAKFCRNCGKPLAVVSLGQTTVRETPVRQPAAAARSMEIAPEQGKSATAPSAKKKTAKRPAEKTRRAASDSTAAAAKQAVMIPQIQTLTASATAGEFDLGMLDLPELSGGTEQITGVVSPIAGIFRSIGSFISGIFRIFKNPPALIGTLALAALYYYLALNRGSDSPVIKWLSLLTYSEGGYNRGSLDSVQRILGTVGGTLGKGTAAAALLSLFNGGLIRTFKGIGTFFKGHGEKRSILSILFGIILGAALFFAFAGREPSEGSFIAGIGGALLALQALGGSSGKLYALAQSLTSRVSNGVRTAVQGKCDSLLIGLTLGFAAASAISALLMKYLL